MTDVRALWPQVLAAVRRTDRQAAALLAVGQAAVSDAADSGLPP